MADLPDLELAVSTAIEGIYSNMGEVCSAGSRLLVERPIYDEFMARFIAQGQHAFTAGEPLDPATNMGPLVDKESQQRVLAMIAAGKEEGARLHFGGDIPLGLDDGAYVNPTLFGDVNNQMSIARKEIFGPVASVIPFDGTAEAISIANDTIYGLAAGIWTSDINRAFRLVKDIEAGVVWVNNYEDGDMTQPFGGYKQSGQARDKCMESLKSYTQCKSAWIRLSST